MVGHKLWIEKGINKGIFLLAGSIKPNIGGIIIAHNISYQDLNEELKNDPFIEHDIVKVAILEVEPSKTDERLGFLQN